LYFFESKKIFIATEVILLKKMNLSTAKHKTAAKCKLKTASAYSKFVTSAPPVADARALSLQIRFLHLLINCDHE
jgi:hypothetical protein